MSFSHDEAVMHEGNLVILYLNKDSMYTLTLKQNETFQTKYGCVRHNDIINKPYGSKIDCTHGYVYTLKPTPELWTINLPHRTQILYTTDISMVIGQLDLKPGSVVVESGTGSGSLSHALIRTIAPTGHLYTYEFHEQRSQIARQEFEEHGLSDNVTVTHRDACIEGFTIEDQADAVFLDLPNPYSAVHHAKKAIKTTGGRLCSFSPCIEQVQRTCVELEKLGFEEIQTLEVLLRSFEIKNVNLSAPNMGEVDDNLSAETETGILEATESEKPKGEINTFYRFKTATPSVAQPGHTGYLTFATLFHKLASKIAENDNKETAHG